MVAALDLLLALKRERGYSSKMSATRKQTLSAFDQCARTALQHLRSRQKEIKAFRGGTDARFKGTSLSVHQIVRFDPFRLLTGLSDRELEGLPDVRQAAQLLADSKQHRRFYGSQARRVVRVVEYYVYHRRTLRYNPRQFQEDLESHMTMWSTHFAPLVITCPIINIKQGRGIVRLAPNVRLRPFTDRMRRDFWASVSDLPGSSPEDLMSSHYVLEILSTFDCSMFARNKIDLRTAFDQETTDDVITALRLASESWIGVVGVQQSLRPSPRADMWYTPHTPMNPGGHLASRPVREAPLANAEVHRARKVFTAIRSIRKTWQYKSIELGLHWFNQAHRRDRLEDSVIALAVALESTVLRELRGDLSYRLTLRGLRLAQLPRQRAEAVAWDLTALYRVRSEIVHAGVTLETALNTVWKKGRKGSPPQASAFVERSRSLVALLLGTCVELISAGEQLNAVLTRVDKEILQSLCAP